MNKQSDFVIPFIDGRFFKFVLIIVPKTKIYIFEKLQRQSYSDDDPGYKPGLSAVVQVIGGGVDQNNTGRGAGVKSMSS